MKVLAYCLANENKWNNYKYKNLEEYRIDSYYFSFDYFYKPNK